MDRVLRILAAVGLAVGLYAVSAQPARATFCALPDIAAALAVGDPVFVGTVTGVRNNDRWALVRVEEIWSGPKLPDTVEVHGSEIVDPNTWTDIDRTFLVGRRYLFELDVQRGVLRDHACTATSLWVDELLRFRPDILQGLEDTASTASGPDANVFAASITLGGIAGGALLWRSRRSRRGRPMD